MKNLLLRTSNPRVGGLKSHTSGRADRSKTLSGTWIQSDIGAEATVARSQNRVAQWDTGAGANVGQKYRTFTHVAVPARVQTP